jgi:hypothetical protein
MRGCNSSVRSVNFNAFCKLSTAGSRYGSPSAIRFKPNSYQAFFFSLCLARGNFFPVGRIIRLEAAETTTQETATVASTSIGLASSRCSSSGYEIRMVSLSWGNDFFLFIKTGNIQLLGNAVFFKFPAIEGIVMNRAGNMYFFRKNPVVFQWN